ncbi:MAG: NAD(P)H-quinone oxidoreductase [Pseudomonadota bacterium]
MAQMIAVEITTPGGPDVLVETQRALPDPSVGEVRIKVAFAGVNRPDALQRAGLYRAPKGASDLPGLECSGVIDSVGPGVPNWTVGDAVCALLPGGGYAEYVTAPAAHCLPVPDGMAMDQAACLPETFFTVWSNVFQRGGLKAGEVFLVHGGSSGIGTTAIQLAKLFGAQVYATAGSAEKCAACEDLGAIKCINYRETAFEDVMKPLGGANVILDMVGGDYIARNIKSLADDGRLVQIAFLQGPKAEVNFAHLMLRRLTFTGSTLRPQSDHAKALIADELRDQVWPLLNQGRIAPVMDSTYALADAAQAHAHMESNAHIGKIVLAVS